MTGHAPREVVLQILRGSTAAPEVIAAAKKFQRETCTQIQAKPRTRVVKPPSKYAFNYEVVMDVFESKDDNGARYHNLSILCQGTC